MTPIELLDDLCRLLREGLVELKHPDDVRRGPRFQITNRGRTELLACTPDDALVDLVEASLSRGDRGEEIDALVDALLRDTAMTTPLEALIALEATWRANSQQAGDNARKHVSALDQRQCVGVSQAYQQCADDLDAVLRAASPREVDIEELQADVWSHAEAHRLVKMERELEDPAAFFGYLREVLFKAARRPDYTVPPAPPREKTNEVDDVSGRGRDRVVGDHSAPVSAHARDMEVGTAETPADTERLPTAEEVREEVRGILAEYRDAGADEVHELPATSGGETQDAQDAQDAQDVTELALFPERYQTVVDHYREMARRFAESRDELKHRCRALEAELAASRAPKAPAFSDLADAGQEP